MQSNDSGKRSYPASAGSQSAGIPGPGGADTSGASSCAGPLAGFKRRDKSKKPRATRDNPPSPHYKRLTLFAGYDERGFHPTVEIEFHDGVLCQCWRHRKTDEAEWRPVKHVNTLGSARKSIVHESLTDIVSESLETPP